MKSAKTHHPAAKSAGVLCGTDFSPNARPAANIAAGLAQRLQTTLELVHVSAAPKHPTASKDLHAEAERLRRQGAAVEEVVLSGAADEAIVKRVQAGSHRLVVVSSLGQRAAVRWLLGSVSERTAERSPCTTLVVRKAAPLEAWLRGERPLKVFVAFNFTATSEGALRWVKELQAIGPCDVVVGYVDWPPEQRSRLGGAEPLPLEGNLPAVQGVLERDLKARVTELLGEGPCRTRVEGNWGRPDARLAAMALEEQADLMVVGSHQYRGFERMWHTSVSRGLLHSAPMSVAVIPLSTREKRAAGMAPPVRRVLAATDFSDLGNQAIAHAYSLVRGGGTVRLVHAMHPHELPRGQYLQGRADRSFETRHAKHVKIAGIKLRALVPVEAAALGIVTEVEVIEHREAGIGIVQAAERFGADVICLGSHGHSGWSAGIMGSITQQVISTSRRPLLVVQPPVK
ncbi:MAG: universal stress protein [Opitutaceae bacterium]|nr:universal stress protein [Opitutaceae bacterium]